MLMTVRVEKHNRLFHYITILITLTAGLSYFVMAAGGGHSFHLVKVIHHDKYEPPELIFRQIYWARYVDWVITTPLLLLDLTLLAGLPGIEIILVILADIVMVLFVCPLSELTTGDVRWVYTHKSTVGVLCHFVHCLPIRGIKTRYLVTSCCNHAIGHCRKILYGD